MRNSIKDQKMRDNRIIYTSKKIAGLEIESENRGMVIAWNYIRGKITSTKFASIVFQDQDVLDRRGIGGYFTVKSFVNILYLSKEYLKNGKLYLEDDKDAAVFLHECSHFLHLACSGGKYTQPLAEEMKLRDAKFGSPSDRDRYFVEREAWHLSNSLNRVFHIGIQEEIDRVNTRNMLIVSARCGVSKMSKIEMLTTDPLPIEKFNFKDL